MEVVYVSMSIILLINVDCEPLSVEIICKHSKNIIVTTMYRPPNNNVTNFLTILKDNITRSKVTSKHLYIIGDINIIYLRTQQMKKRLIM